MLREDRWQRRRTHSIRARDDGTRIGHDMRVLANASLLYGEYELVQ